MCDFGKAVISNGAIANGTPVRSGREFLYRLVQLSADQPESYSP